MTREERAAWLRSLKAGDLVVVETHRYGREPVESGPVPVEKAGAGRQYGWRVNGDWYAERDGERHGSFYTSDWSAIRPVPTAAELAEREAARAAKAADEKARAVAIAAIVSRLGGQIVSPSWSPSESVPTAALVQIAERLPDCVAIIGAFR